MAKRNKDQSRRPKPKSVPKSDPKPELKSEAIPQHSDYAVGYGKPPLTARFKPGQSGNRQGRPKGADSLKTLVRKEFDQRISVQEGSKSRKLTKKEALIKATINRAMQKGGKDADTALKLLAITEDVGDQNLALLAPLDEGGAEILAAHEARMLRRLMAEIAVREGKAPAVQSENLLKPELKLEGKPQ